MRQTSVGVEEVLAALKRLRITSVWMETEIHALMAQEFQKAGVPFHREHSLGRGSRVDFYVPGGIAVEVKKGKPNTAMVKKQIERYAAYPEVKALVLVVERNINLPPQEAHEKPVYYVALSRNWGVAL